MKRRNLAPVHSALPDAEHNSSSSAPSNPSPVLPPDSLGKWPGFLLAWVAELAGGVYARELTPLGIKPQHLGILTLLESEGPVVQARLSDRLPIVKPVIVGLINELEARGLVERRPHPTDQRAFEIHLLDKGQQCIDAAEKISQAVTTNFFSDLTDEEQQTFYHLLWRLANSNSRTDATVTRGEKL